MDAHDNVPVGVFHVSETEVPDDAGVVDQDIQTAKVSDGRIDKASSIFHTAIVGHGLSPRSHDFVDH